jgi:hypothetical protein
MTEQPRLDVLRPQRLGKQDVLPEIDLGGRYIIRQPPKPFQAVFQENHPTQDATNRYSSA